ncbi:hypothetical protein GCM10010205_81250 [Streptomyces nojiriensis]|nr:hypothetical protein GCM10010205_81250 [Streptomyces nojiriensis]
MLNTSAHGFRRPSQFQPGPESEDIALSGDGQGDAVVAEHLPAGQLAVPGTGSGVGRAVSQICGPGPNAGSKVYDPPGLQERAPDDR